MNPNLPTAERRVERDYIRENHALRIRVEELELKLQNFRQAWQQLNALAQMPVDES